jgi:hypothetical protein
MTCGRQPDDQRARLALAGLASARHFAISLSMKTIRIIEDQPDMRENLARRRSLHF